MTPLDTGLLPPASRLAAVRAFLRDAGLPVAVGFDSALGASRHCLSAHQLTTAVTALEVAGTSTRLTSGARGEC